MKRLGNVLIILGAIYALGTAGASDTMFVPIWRIFLQLGIATAAIIIGCLLRRTKEAKK